MKSLLQYQLCLKCTYLHGRAVVTVVLSQWCCHSGVVTVVLSQVTTSVVLSQWCCHKWQQVWCCHSGVVTSGVVTVVLLQRCCHSGVVLVVLPQWCCHSGVVTVVLSQWCCHSGVATVVLSQVEHVFPGGQSHNVADMYLPGKVVGNSLCPLSV